MISVCPSVTLFCVSPDAQCDYANDCGDRTDEVVSSLVLLVCCLYLDISLSVCHTVLRQPRRTVRLRQRLWRQNGRSCKFSSIISVYIWISVCSSVTLFCVSSDAQCDYANDCGDRTDEVVSSQVSFLSISGYQSVRLSHCSAAATNCDVTTVSASAQTHSAITPTIVETEQTKL